LQTVPVTCAIANKLEDGLNKAHAGAQGLTQGLLNEKRVPRPGSAQSATAALIAARKPTREFRHQTTATQACVLRPDNIAHAGEGLPACGWLVIQGRLLKVKIQFQLELPPRVQILGVSAEHGHQRLLRSTVVCRPSLTRAVAKMQGVYRRGQPDFT